MADPVRREALALFGRGPSCALLLAVVRRSDPERRDDAEGSASVSPSPSENFTYAEGPITELDSAQMDTGHGIRLFDSPAHLARFRALLAQMESSALSEEKSRDLIRSIKEEV